MGSRRCRLERLPGGALPDTRACVPGGILQTAEIGTDAFAEPALSEALDGCVCESARARAGALMEGVTELPAGWLAPRAPRVPRGSPSASCWSSAARAEPARGRAAPEGCRAGSRARRRSTSPPVDPLGLPRLLPPHRPRSGRAAHAGGGAGPGAHAEGRLRARASSTTRSRSRSADSGVALRAFDADRVEGRAGSDHGPRRAASRGAGRAPEGTLVIADEVRPLALLFGALAAGRGVRPKTSGLPLRVQVKGCPISPCRKRCGWRPR